MSDTPPLADAPAQQRTHADILADRRARDQREADEDAAADKAKAEADADATHGGLINIPSTNPAASNLSPTPPLPEADGGGTANHTAAENEAAKQQAAQDETARQRDPDKMVDPTPEQIEAAEHAKREAEQAEQAEKDKADRAERGVTGAENGDPAGVAFGARIEQAKFEHRNQGADGTMALIDDLMAALLRLEGKLAGG